jgi:hypothetical protein
MRLPASIIAAAAFLALTCAPALAGTLNDVPSCYAAAHIQPADGRGYARLFYVLIDQTVAWNRDIESSIMDNLNQNLTPGTKFIIAEFSAFAQGRYLDVLHTGIIEAPLPPSQIGNTPIEAARLFSTCLAGQRPYAVRMADAATIGALEGSNGSLANSDILLALDQVSSAVAGDPAPDKGVFLASDGLENSTVTSFYRHGAIRDIDPAQELARAKGAGLIGNFGGAKAYVIGGALPPPGAAFYEGSITLRNLADFWTRYFRLSNARLVEFGEPALLRPLRF